MKLLSIITHPIFQVISFLIVLISGESFGGPYAMYLYHAAFDGLLYAWVGIVGIIICLISIFWEQKKLQIIAAIFMSLSLIIFFTQTNGSYNYGTFHQLLPMLTLLLFATINGLVLYKHIDNY